MLVGLGALTGVPLGLTATRVPAASAFLCSRWTRAFFEMGISSVVVEVVVVVEDGGLLEKKKFLVL